MKLAKEFQKWIYEDVIVSIRKNGSYIGNSSININNIIKEKNE